MSIHRLVAIAFISNPDMKPQINHIDGDRENNRASNLEWATMSENTKHAHKLGLINQNGSKNHRSKLKESDVLDIRNRINSGSSNKELAKDYFVTDGCIQHIRTRKNWAHI